MNIFANFIQSYNFKSTKISLCSFKNRCGRKFIQYNEQSYEKLYYH